MFSDSPEDTQFCVFPSPLSFHGLGVVSLISAFPAPIPTNKPIINPIPANNKPTAT
jgi:hypothetical protein